ncbi:MAG: elongation factor 1-beta [Archaeoglobales archaeon]|nr:elongation factor 1-beta [Archaeoglobales archaeon]
MAKVMMKIRVMPTDVDVDLKKMAEKIKETKVENVEIKDLAIKPLAFGIKALYILTVMPDEGGIGDKFVEEVQKIEGVESVEIEDMELL